jgi:hypothetical protein
MSFPGMSAKEVFNGSLDVVDEYVAKGEIPVIMAWSIIRQAALNSGAPAEQTGNSRYATALEKLLCDWFFESGLDLDDVSDKMKTELIQRLNALRAAHSA